MLSHLPGQMWCEFKTICLAALRSASRRKSVLPKQRIPHTNYRVIFKARLNQKAPLNNTVSDTRLGRCTGVCLAHLWPSRLHPHSRLSNFSALKKDLSILTLRSSRRAQIWCHHHIRRRNWVIWSFQPHHEPVWWRRGFWGFLITICSTSNRISSPRKKLGRGKKNI